MGQIREFFGSYFSTFWRGASDLTKFRICKIPPTLKSNLRSLDHLAPLRRLNTHPPDFYFFSISGQSCIYILYDVEMYADVLLNIFLARVLIWSCIQAYIIRIVINICCFFVRKHNTIQITQYRDDLQKMAAKGILFFVCGAWVAEGRNVVIVCGT